LDLILDNLRRAAGVLFAWAEQVGVVALPLIADQLLQLFEERVTRGKRFSSRPDSRVSSPDSARASADFRCRCCRRRPSFASANGEVFDF
jgi:hypothetical protein